MQVATTLLESWTIYQWIALLLGGFVCGFINTLAGGGSMITMPLLIFLGLTSKEANATNRFALSFQYLTSAWGFWTAGVQDSKTTLRFLLPGLVGCLLGSQLALFVSAASFKKILAVLLLVIVYPVVTKKELWTEKVLKQATPTGGPFAWILFFFLGLYSGFIQVGVGIWSLIALLSLGSFQLNHANAIKAQFLFLLALVATVIFAFSGKIYYGVGAMLALGTSVGAWVATRVAVKSSLWWLKGLIICVVVGSALKLLGLF